MHCCHTVIVIIILIDIYRWLLQIKNGSKEDAIHNAIENIHSRKCSFHKAELKYGIPKNTQWLHHRQSRNQKKTRRSTSTHKDEEQYLVNLAVEVNKIGYGQTRRQRCEKILDKGGRPNPFKDNHPGKDWWYRKVWLISACAYHSRW